jgi:hypothetical protein
LAPTKLINRLHLVIYVRRIIHAQPATRRLAQQAVQAHLLAHVIPALRLFGPILFSNQIAAELGRHEHMLLERAAHRMTRLAAILAVVNLALLAHERGVLEPTRLLAEHTPGRTHLTLDAQLSRLAVPLDNVLQARVLD